MPRRVASALLATALLTVGLVGCSDDAGPAPQATAPQVTAPAPPTQAVTPTPLAAAPTPQVPAGTAPDKAFAVGVREMRLNRDGKRPLPVTVWYPAAGKAGAKPARSADAAGGSSRW